MPGRLDVRLLGPVAVYRDGDPAPLRGGKGRALLALLALNAGTVVSADSLVEALWGDKPTPTARTGLQIQISKLRKVLAEGDARLQTRPPGYVLAIDPEQVDVFRFDEAIAAAREASAGGDAAHARALIDRALEEWRGDPLAGVDAPGLDEAVITDLLSRRTAAWVVKAEAELALADHREAVQTLEHLTAEEPLDERIHALAATALYRFGRQADALDVLSRLRRALSDEFGIEPGAAITQLEQMILRHDVALEPSSMEHGLGEDVPTAVREGRKTVTALACRLDAVTTDGRHLDPEARGGVTAGIAELVRGVVVAHGAVSLDVPGELLGAVFGVPRVHEDDIERAISVATQLLDLGTDEGGHPSPMRLEIRVGIATGEVLIEDQGVTERLLSAGPVEEAAQLVRSARAGEILVSDAAAKRSSTIAGSQPRELLVLSEGAPPTLTYRLSAVPAVAPPRHRAPLVGRQDQLAVLTNALERVRIERSCSLVTLLGPAGVGKSRLVAALVDDREDVLVLRGRCQSYGRDMSLWPIIEMISGAVGVSFDHPSQQVRRKIAKLLEGLDDADFVEHQLTGLLGLTNPASPADELFWAIRRFFEALARDRPVIAIVDDAHWADAALLDLLEHVATWARGTPLLLLVVGRPELLEARSGWGSGRFDATTLPVQPLSEEQGGELLRHLLRDTRFAPAAEARILRAAEGNPLFLEELLAMVSELGTDEAGRIGLVDMPIPPSVQAILEARLDRLPPNLRRTLERAAVVGKEFSHEDLRSITPDDDQGSLADAVDQLVGRDLVGLEQISSRGRTYAFRHILIRDVAEAGASKRVRALDHELFGRELERRAGDRLPEVQEIVGYHLETAYGYRAELGLSPAGLPALAENAAGHLFAAGVRAYARGDAAATSLFGRALQLTPKGSADAPERWRLRGLALFDGGRAAEADDAFAAGLVAAEAIGDEREVWRIRVEQADLWNHVRPESVGSAQLEAVGRTAIAALEQDGDVAGLARAERLLGDALMLGGRQEEAATAFTAARVHALEVGDEREAEESLSSGAVIGQVPVERCVEMLAGALEGHPRPNPNLLSALGLALAMAGDFARSREAIERGLSSAMELGAEWRALSVRMYAALSLLVEGDANGAEEVVRPAVEGLQRMGDRALLASAGHLLAEALWRSGRADEAMLATVLAQGVTVEDDLAAEMGWRGVRAKILADRGETREAEALARRAAELGSTSEFLLFAGWAYEDLAYVLAAEAKDDEARETLDSARAVYEKKGSVASLARLARESQVEMMRGL